MARRARKSAFATPLVLVLGCGKPAPRTLTVEQIANSAPPIDAALPVDAYVDLSPDAEPEYTAEEIADHCSGRLQPVWNCNPPPPDRTATGNPPPALELRVINVSISGDAVAVTFNKGTNDGLSTGMKGYLVNDRKKVPGSDFVLNAVTERTARAALRLTVDQIRASATAVIER